MHNLMRMLRYDLPLHFVLLFTNWLPDSTPFLVFRGFLAHYFIGSCGKNLRLGRNIIFYNPINIHFGQALYVAHGCIFITGEKIVIEDEVMFGPYCVIVSGNHTKIDGSFRFGKPHDKPIRIGKGTWLGAHVTLASGVEVGPGCLVAANSVVIEEIFPANSMIAGTPAKVIKSDI